MNRRGFLGLVVGAPIGAVIDWNPLGRTIFLPPRGGWMRTNNLRSDLLDAIYNVDPFSTPLFSMMKKRAIELIEWKVS